MSNVFFPIMHRDSVASSHPISVDVNNPDEINEIFDGITYGKVYSREDNNRIQIFLFMCIKVF